MELYTVRSINLKFLVFFYICAFHHSCPFHIDQTVSPSNIDHCVCFPTGFCTVGLKIVFFLEFTIQTTNGMSLAADRTAPRAGIRTWEKTKTE